LHNYSSEIIIATGLSLVVVVVVYITC